MARAGLLTARGIEAAKHRSNDRWLSDAIRQRNAGRLLIRISPKGAKHFYFRYTGADGKRIAILLGPFTPQPKPNALTLQQARDKADEYRRIHKAPESRDLRAYFKRQEKARLETEALEALRLEQQRAAADAALRFTVRALAAAYVAHLETKSKHRSALDAANIFKNHLEATEFAGLPAKDLTSKNAAELVRRVVEAGHGRTAAKFRSYLRAAYALALGADLDPATPSAFIGFQLTANPVASVEAKSLAQFNRTRDRTLSQDELFDFWRHLDAVQSLAPRSALKLALLLGGQRPAQLLRLRRVDVDLRAGRLVLFDPKGKRTEPRPHELPISDAAMETLEPCVAASATLKSEWVFTNGGKVPVTPHTLMVEVREIAAAMVTKGKATEAFSLSDLRRTAETTLAALGIPQDVRAQIQSHGLGGVQQKHYNRHDYRPEKREALEKWAAWLLAGPQKVAKVVQARDTKHRRRAR